MSIISEMDEIRALAADLAQEMRTTPREDCATQFVAIFGDGFSVAHRRPRVWEVGVGIGNRGTRPQVKRTTPSGTESSAGLDQE